MTSPRPQSCLKATPGPESVCDSWVQGPPTRPHSLRRGRWELEVTIPLPSPRFPSQTCSHRSSQWRWEVLRAKMENGSSGCRDGGQDRPTGPAPRSRGGEVWVAVPFSAAWQEAGRGNRCPPTAGRKQQGNHGGDRKRAPCHVLYSLIGRLPRCPCPVLWGGMALGEAEMVEASNDPSYRERGAAGRDGVKAKCL